MANSDVDIDFDEVFRQVMAQPGVQGAVQDRGAKIATVARREMLKSGIKGTVSVDPVYVSSGRAAVNVNFDVDEKDRGRAIGIARRASRSVRR